MAAATAPRGVLLAGSTVGLVLLVALVSLLPVPYVSLSPGSVYDTLGAEGGEPLIRISGRPTHPTAGSLHLTTVAVAGGPGSALTLPHLLTAWLDRDTSLLHREQLYEEDETVEEADAEGVAQMSGSQVAAEIAALRELGVELPPGLSVLSAEGPADGLRPGDVLTAVGGAPVEDVAQLRARVAEAGVGADVRLTVERDGQEADVVVRTTEGEDGTPRLGVVLAPYDLPVRIDFSLADVIGPSAGLMFALAIVDELTPGAMTGGEHIAGTGAITPQGDVLVIGGLRQKLIAARDAGAEYFLAPAPECAEVRGEVPEGLRLVPVRTLREARLAVEAIGEGREEALPSCPA